MQQEQSIMSTLNSEVEEVEKYINLSHFLCD